MFKEIMSYIKDDIKKDVNLMLGKDIRPIGQYSRYELKNLGPIATVKALKMSWDELTKTQQEARDAEFLTDTTQRTFKEKMKAFYNTHKRSIVVGLNLAVLAGGVGLNYNKIKTEIEETYGNLIPPAAEKVQIDSSVVDDKDTIKVGDYEISLPNDDEKIQENEFKQDLKEDVKKEEELTQEELEQRAQEIQEKAEVTPEIDKTLE